MTPSSGVESKSCLERPNLYDNFPVGLKLLGQLTDIAAHLAGVRSQPDSVLASSDDTGCTRFGTTRNLAEKSIIRVWRLRAATQSLQSTQVGACVSPISVQFDFAEVFPSRAMKGECPAHGTWTYIQKLEERIRGTMPSTRCLYCLLKFPHPWP